MKYALKPSSYFLNVNGSNKIVFIEDEKQLVSFFQHKMKQDLTNPILKSERYNWANRHKPNDVSSADMIGYYSFLISADVDLKYLSWTSRVTKMLSSKFPGTKPWGFYSIVARMRSLPCNWTLYELVDDNQCGKVLQQMGWGVFFRKAQKLNLFDGIDLSYKIKVEE